MFSLKATEAMLVSVGERAVDEGVEEGSVEGERGFLLGGNGDIIGVVRGGGPETGLVGPVSVIHHTSETHTPELWGKTGVAVGGFRNPKMDWAGFRISALNSAEESA